MDWVTLDVNGRAGGILILWDKSVVDYRVLKYSVCVKFKGIDDGNVWNFRGIYGPNEDRRSYGSLP